MGIVKKPVKYGICQGGTTKDRSYYGKSLAPKKPERKPGRDGKKVYCSQNSVHFSNSFFN